MFDWILNAPLNAIASSLAECLASSCSKSYPVKWKFSQCKIPQVLRKENENEINFFGPLFREQF